MLSNDRWLEMDLTWFDPDQALAPQLETLLTRVAPLLHSVSGDRGIFFNIGWLIDVITEWTGNPQQKIPTRSRRTAKWAARTYQELKEFIALLRQKAAQHTLPNLKVGILFVQWAHVVWPPELKIYDFDSDWYERHPELYEPPKSFIGMPDLYPINRLHADQYTYATYPTGLREGAYFPDFFGSQWGHLADFLNLDALHLRDGFMGPMIYTRNGPYGTIPPSDPKVIEAFSEAVRDLFKAVKVANPSKLIFGYSSAISPIADWRVGCVDFETLVADGYIDGWIEQTWGGAWQDWWHQLWKGWTFQTANLLTRGAMIARANQKRQKPCKFYNLIETWDGWEPWDTLHQVPHKLRWAMWAFSHTAVATPAGLKTPDGSYISWMNNGAMELLNQDDVEYINTHLNLAQTSASQLEEVFGPTLVYNRAMMAWLSQHHPDWQIAEWLDDQAAMLMKWGSPILSITRTEWLADLKNKRDALIVQTPGQLDETTRTTLQGTETPVVVVGRADMVDASLREKLGIEVTPDLVKGGFHVAQDILSPEQPPYDRPYIPQHSRIQAKGETQVHYKTAQTPLLTQKDHWFYWQPPDWSEPFNQFVPKYQLGSTFPHYHMAELLNQAAEDAGQSYLAPMSYAQTIAWHMWRSGGQIYILLGNLETGVFGDSRTPRTFTLYLSRSQLGLKAGEYHLKRVDSLAETLTALPSTDQYLSFSVTLPPEQSAVYVLAL